MLLNNLSFVLSENPNNYRAYNASIQVTMREVSYYRNLFYITTIGVLQMYVAGT